MHVGWIPESPSLNEPVEAACRSEETLALLSRRRSTPIALLRDPGPSSRQIDALLKLAARVPDHGKLGPWRFIVMEGEARMLAGERLAKIVADDPGAGPDRVAAERDRFLRAPACVVVVSTAAPHPKIPEWEQELSAGALCFNLLLAAHALGFAGAWLTEWPTYDERARSAFGLASHERIAGFVYLGTAAEPVLERVRPDIETRISRFA